MYTYMEEEPKMLTCYISENAYMSDRVYYLMKKKTHLKSITLHDIKKVSYEDFSSNYLHFFCAVPIAWVFSSERTWYIVHMASMYNTKPATMDPLQQIVSPRNNWHVLTTPSVKICNNIYNILYHTKINYMNNFIHAGICSYIS